MAWCVASHHADDAPGGARPTAEDQGRGEARGHPRRGVVESGRCPAVAGIALITVADHRVHRVDGAVHQRARRPSNRRPQGGCDHGVDGVLRDRLHHGPAHLGLVEAIGVPTDQGRQQCAGPIEVTG